MGDQTLADVLRRAAHSKGKGFFIYTSGGTDKHTFVSYQQLLRRASENSTALRRIDGFSKGTVFLVHFDNHSDNIEWFWSVVLAGGIPTISTPLTNSTEQRKKHLLHLHQLLSNPICLTREHLVQEFACQDLLRITTVDAISPAHSPALSPVHDDGESPEALMTPSSTHGLDDPVALMLTSGSTGNAKAVCLTNGQIITAL